MIVELGHFSLILALGLGVCLAVLPTLGVYRRHAGLMQLAGSLSAGLFVFLLLSFICLVYAFWADDFSVAYVARNSNSALPLQYKISAVWGAHEGSFLLWTLIMGGWTFAVSLFSRGLSLDMQARVLSILGGISIGFMLFILLTSNPFDRTLPVFPADGADLNPLLQDIGLIVHPPMLYMVSTLDKCGLGISDSRYHTGILVGLLRTGLGRLVVLGCGRERLFHALAHWYSVDSLSCSDREKGGF
jgi:cytochrome c-type biogenesis protein CcmF